MRRVLSLQNGKLEFPTELLEELGIGPDDQIAVDSENGSLVIRPTDEETGAAEPIFHTEEPAPLKLDDLLKEIGPEYTTEAYSDAGLVTRDEFMAMLREYEERFGMSSAEFYEKWQNEELPEKVEFIFWAHMYEESLQKGYGK